MSSKGGGSGDAGGADRGVGVAEAAEDGGEELREVWGESVGVVESEKGDQMQALLADGGFVGGVGGSDGGEKRRKSVGGEGLGDVFELGSGGGVGVSVGELVEAGQYSVFQLTFGRGSRLIQLHCRR